MEVYIWSLLGCWHYCAFHIDSGGVFNSYLKKKKEKKANISNDNFQYRYAYSIWKTGTAQSSNFSLLALYQTKFHKYLQWLAWLLGRLTKIFVPISFGHTKKHGYMCVWLIMQYHDKIVKRRKKKMTANKGNGRKRKMSDKGR